MERQSLAAPSRPSMALIVLRPFMNGGTLTTKSHSNVSIPPIGASHNTTSAPCFSPSPFESRNTVAVVEFLNPAPVAVSVDPRFPLLLLRLKVRDGRKAAGSIGALHVSSVLAGRNLDVPSPRFSRVLDPGGLAEDDLHIARLDTRDAFFSRVMVSEGQRDSRLVSGGADSFHGHVQWTSYRNVTEPAVPTTDIKPFHPAGPAPAHHLRTRW